MIEENLKREDDVYIEDGYVTLNKNYEYNIALDRCNTPEKLISWIYHLQEKRWMTPDRFRKFISLVSQHFGFNYTILS